MELCNKFFPIFPNKIAIDMNNNFFSPQEQKVWDDIISLYEQYQKVPAIYRDSKEN